VTIQEPQQGGTGGALGHVLPISGVYLDLAASTLMYLVAQVTWSSGGTMVAYGKIAGRMYPN
jgi:hypothetical protein